MQLWEEGECHPGRSLLKQSYQCGTIKKAAIGVKASPISVLPTGSPLTDFSFLGRLREPQRHSVKVRRRPRGGGDREWSKNPSSKVTTHNIGHVIGVAALLSRSMVEEAKKGVGLRRSACTVYAMCV